MKRQKVLVRGIICGCLAWFALWACAPMMSAPPAPPMAESLPKEVGGGLSAGAALDVTGVLYVEPVANLDGWYRVRISDRHEAGGLVSLGVGSFGLAAGGYYRFSFVNGERSNLGLEVSGGWLWTGLELPMAWRVGENMWFTTKPGYKSAVALGLFHVPVGLSWDAGESARWDTELGVHGPEAYLGSFVPYGSVAYSKAF